MHHRTTSGAMSTADLTARLNQLDSSTKSKLALPDLILILLEVVASIGLLILMHVTTTAS